MDQIKFVLFLNKLQICNPDDKLPVQAIQPIWWKSKTVNKFDWNTTGPEKLEYFQAWNKINIVS